MVTSIEERIKEIVYRILAPKLWMVKDNLVDEVAKEGFDRTLVRATVDKMLTNGELPRTWSNHIQGGGRHRPSSRGRLSYSGKPR